MSTNILLKDEMSIDRFVIGGKKMWSFYLRIVNLSIKDTHSTYCSYLLMVYRYTKANLKTCQYLRLRMKIIVC